MPSSDYNTIPKVLQVVERLRPRSILDVGVGNGRYGFLFREILDLNYGRFESDKWQVRIDGVEVDASYIASLWPAVYDYIHIGDFNQIDIPGAYDLVFMGDVLEHWPDGEWPAALQKAKNLSAVTLVVCPNHPGSMAQGAWMGHESERHLSLLSPETVGGRCLAANSKWFMCGFDNTDSGILDDKAICL